MDKRFQIVTDSSCDLPQAMADELDLAVLPLHVHIGEETYANYLDGREIGFHDFFNRIASGEKATTSAVNVEEFKVVMEQKLQEGLDILFIGFSSGLSTTYQSGAIACQELQEKYPERRLIAIDSLCASIGEGLLVYLAAKKQQSGASMDEVADFVRETIPHLCHWFTVNDLMFLKRGGRVDAATALVGTVLQIKPVMHMDDAGTLKNVTKARGRKAALKALAQRLADTATDPADQTVFICHGDCLDDAEYTAEQISLLYENLWRNGFMVSGLAVAALAALFNGISQFWYLYSPRKIDFYHSLPVKRSRMFWYKSLQSLLYFLLPYLVMEFFSVCIGAMRGFFSLHLMKMAFVMLVFHLLLYLLLYFSVVLVICITGHLLMGALLLVAAAAYGPVFSVLLDLYERAFYYTRSESSYCLVKVLKELISPVALAYTFVKKYAEGNYGGMLIAVLLVTAVLGGLGYCAFVHRKSERTGMAFVFPWAGTAVKFLVVVSGGLGIGFVFYMLSNDSSRTIWWIFGLILGTILSGGIMEIIYYRDFRKFFSHKLQFAVNGACVALVACVFFFDLAGYDEYIPSYDKIENIAIGSADNSWEIAYNVKVNEDGTVTMLDSGDSVGNDLGVDQNIYEIMKKLAKESKAAYKEILQDSHSMWSSNLWDPSGNTLGIKVRYDLKSGSVVYRKYMVGLDDIKNLWKEGMTEGTLKSEYYSILELDDKYVDEVKCDFITGQSISLFQDNKAKKQLLV